MPILEPELVADRTVDAILTNQRILLIPRMLYFFNFLKGYAIQRNVEFFFCHLVGKRNRQPTLIQGCAMMCRLAPSM